MTDRLTAKQQRPPDTKGKPDELRFLQPHPGTAVHVEGVAHLRARFYLLPTRWLSHESIRPERLVLRGEPLTPTLDQAGRNLNPQDLDHRGNVSARRRKAHAISGPLAPPPSEAMVAMRGSDMPLRVTRRFRADPA